MHNKVRLVQLNVKRFTDQHGQSTVEGIAEFLAPLLPSIVAFNEVDTHLRPDAIKDISTRLGMHPEFFGHVRGRYGNVLLSKFPVLSTAQHHLRGGTEWALPAGTKKLNGEIAKDGETHRITRGMLCVEIIIPPSLSPGDDKHCSVAGVRGAAKGGASAGGGMWMAAGRRVRVSVTHLDHMNEEERRIQLSHIVEILHRDRDEAVGGYSDADLLVGDMNALTRQDYSDTQWRALEEVHRANGWSAPVFGCLDILTQHSFVDCLLASREHVQQTEIDACQGGGGNNIATCGGIYTTPAMAPRVRVDYCFARGTGVGVEGAKVMRWEGGAEPLSDHCAVVFDLTLATL
jgi:endonuclease/exonuclease/phosphatase family metal-dependent hydrolase